MKPLSTARSKAKIYWVRVSWAIFFIWLSAPLYAQERLIPFEQGGKWGYQNASGKEAIPPHFSVANEFSPEGIAPVVDEQGWAYIDARGKILIRPFIVDNGPDYFQEGLARFMERGKFGFFNQKGQVVIQPRFDFAAPFSEGLAAYCTGCQMKPEGELRLVEGGIWGYMDPKGNVAITPRFEAAENFASGKARVKLEGQWMAIDKKGKSIMDKNKKGSIGAAWKEEDGTIVLQLRAEAPGGIMGDALLRYPPGNGEYQEILRHLGGLEKGEKKAVPPWPEKNK
jgi:hypothetical protein